MLSTNKGIQSWLLLKMFPLSPSSQELSLGIQKEISLNFSKISKNALSLGFKCNFMYEEDVRFTVYSL